MAKHKVKFEKFENGQAVFKCQECDRRLAYPESRGETVPEADEVERNLGKCDA